MAKRRKNPSNDLILMLAVGGGAALYLLLRKKAPDAPISVPPEHAKQVQENLNHFFGPPLPVTGVYDEATAARLVIFANWVDAAMKVAAGAVGKYALLNAQNGLFHNPEIVMLQVGDRKQQTTRSVYDYLFTRPLAPVGCIGNDCHYTPDDKKYMIAARPVGIPGIAAGG